MSTALAEIKKTPLSRTRFCEETVEFKGRLEEGFIELGKRLMLIRENRLYADNWDTFEDYVLEFRNMSEPTATKLINLYKVLVLKYRVSGKLIAQAGGWSNLSETIPLIKSKEDALHWVHIATENTRTGLRRFITEAKTGKSMTGHKHDKPYHLLVYPCCGLRERLVDNN